MSMSTEKLSLEIRRHKRLYYIDAKPEISNAEFDSLENQLRELDPNHSTLSMVGAELLEQGDKVRHSSFMGSLDKIHTPAEVADWMREGIGDEVHAEWKLDGLAMSIVYINGKLSHAATRGDGIQGEVVTENAKNCRGVPESIGSSFKIGPPFSDGEFEVRGEVVCSRENFEKFSSEFSNPRNFATGSLKQNDPNVTAQRGLDFVVYTTLRNGMPIDIDVKDLILAGFFPLPRERFVEEIRGPSEMISTFSVERDSYQFDTDGIVFKQGSRQIAFKFANEEATTILRKIEWNLSRTGRLVPRAIFDPVVLAGATIRHATLNNAQWALDIGVVPGATVLVSRRNDVIPCVEKVVENGPVPSLFLLPTSCEGNPTEMRGDHLYVVGFDDSVKKRWEDAVHFFYCCEPFGFGETLFKRLWENCFSSIPEMLDTVRNERETFDKIAQVVGPAYAERFFKCVRAVLEEGMSMDRFLVSLNIEGLGGTRSRLIAEHFSSLDAFLEAIQFGPTCLYEIPGVGDTTAAKVVGGIEKKLEEIRAIVEILPIKDVSNKVAPKSSTPKEGVLSGSTFCFTGAIQRIENGRRLTRSDMYRIVGEFGGLVSEKVTETDFLVLADVNSTSSKARSARENGVEMLFEEEFFQRLER